MSRRLLVLSYHFPPQAGVASMRLANLVRHLPERGWRVDVIAGPFGPDRDDSLGEALELDSVVRLKPRARVPGLQGADWAAAAARPARRLARNADAVLISGGPFASFALGPLLGRPYVLDFRDPWSWEPRFGRLEARRRRRVGLMIERRAEMLAVRRAASVITVAPQITDRYLEIYPELDGRIETLRHGWEPRDFASPTGVDSAMSPLLLYAGTFATGERTPELLVETARLVRASGTPLRVLLLGRLPDDQRQLTASAEAEGWLEVGGMVSHRSVIEALGTASAVWLQPGDLPFLITGKVYESLASRRPLVAVTPPTGALAELLATTGGAIVAGPEAATCATAVNDALAGRAPTLREDVVDALATPVLATRLAAILDRAAA